MKTPFYGVEDISYYLPLNDLINAIRECCFNFLNYLLDTVEHLIIFCIVYILICILLYLCIITWKWLSFDREIRNSKRVLFIIAHPDDECMFFGPTIQYYTRKKNCVVYLMCLSTGNIKFFLLNYSTYPIFL